MKYFTLTLSLLISPLLAAQDAANYRAITKELGDRLRTELMEAIKKGGPLSALEVCHTKAPQVSEQIAQSSGIQVKRTSLKPRNPLNAPDEWETPVLKTFEKRLAQGEDPQKIEFYEAVVKDGQRQIRYLKAIPTVELCLTCHGKQLTAELQTKLHELYPQDQAVGFQVGDLRGAFSLTDRRGGN